MKSASYESAPGALLALFASREPFFKADLYTITFLDGAVLRTTDADMPITVDGHTFACCAPSMVRTKVTLKVGVEADSMDLTVLPWPEDTIGGMIWPLAARLGYLDGAQVLVETAYWDRAGIEQWTGQITVTGTMHVFQGFVSDVFPDRTQVRVTVKDALELLAQNFPHNVYQSVCLHTVYDAGCAVSKASFTTTSTVASSPAPTLNSVKTGHAQAAGYFDQGVLAFTSGANAGLKRTVKSYDPSTGFTFALPLPVAPAVGDGVSVYPGCDKTLATCRTKFSNPGRFRGFPWVPTPEMGTPPIPGYSKQGGK